MAFHRLGPFQRHALLIGAIMSFGLAAAIFVLRIPVEAWLTESVPALFGSLLLWSPYVGLAFIAADALAAVRHGALVLLVALTVLTWWSASADAQGGLIAFYTLPTQWLIAMLTGLGPVQRTRRN